MASLRPFGAAEGDRLAGDHGRDGVPDVHRVRVHDPGHRLGVGVDVRGGDVALGADEDADLGREAAGQALELALAELLGVDDDAALAAAERDAHDGALPGHPHRQGLDLVEGDVLVVADAALGRAAAEVVLDAIAGEDLHRAVVHLHREVDRQLALRLAQDLAQSGRQVELLGSQVELRWATCQALIAAAICSVAIGRIPSMAVTATERVLRLTDAARCRNSPDDVAAAFRCPESGTAGSTWLEYSPAAKCRHTPVVHRRMG